MNKTFLLITLSILISACSSSDEPFIYGYRMDLLGRDVDAPIVESQYTQHTYTNESIELLQIPKPSTILKKGLQQQQILLKNFSTTQVNPNFILDLDTSALKSTIETLLTWSDSDSLRFLETFELHKLNGRDQKGHVLFTGYYTPIHTLRTRQDTSYRFPVFYHSLVKRKTLEEDTIYPKLAWAKQNINRSIRLQGSGFLKIGGHQKLVGYYPKINSHLKIPANDSLDMKRNLFFEKKGAPSGAGLVPLTAFHTIAVDPNYIPLGSCLLAAVPILDKRGRFIRHEFRILLAQDKGGAVKKMHVDLYFGVGSKAYDKASLMKHYGRLWLIKLKQ